ncbi:MAG: hypothetical protein AVDCRST_MAG25-1902, partial [uncultured Rubrobacteraceae bacterium]
PMVAPVARSTSALDLPALFISSACWERRPNTTEQFSTLITGSTFSAKEDSITTSPDHLDKTVHTYTSIRNGSI